MERKLASRRVPSSAACTSKCSRSRRFGAIGPAVKGEAISSQQSARYLMRADPVTRRTSTREECYENRGRRDVARHGTPRLPVANFPALPALYPPASSVLADYQLLTTKYCSLPADC